jgi:hypothetical protein
MAWLTDARIDRAREILETTTEPVENIGRLTGLGAPASVRAAFHRRIGISPKEYRAVWRGSSSSTQATGRAGAFAVEAVVLGGPVSLVDDAGRMASELVASALRHTDAPVELTVDAGYDVVRIEVRDDDASLPGSGRVVSFELREASTAV